MTVEIDGSMHEGGGGLVRNAIALSLHTGKPARIYNIRRNRSKPGLQPQHLASIRIAQKISGSDVQGLVIGSEEVLFIPQKPKGGTYEIDIGTAGSIPLMLQSILLPAMLSGEKYIIRAKGGTDVPNAMGIDYTSSIFGFSLKEYAAISIDTKKRGYYPEGGGRADIIISSRYTDFDSEDYNGISLSNDFHATKISVRMNASKQLSEARILEKIEEYASMDMAKTGIDHSIFSYYQDSLGKGMGMLLSINGITGGKEAIIGESIIIEKRESPEYIAARLSQRIKELLSNNVPCDYHLADQLIPFLTFLGGSIRTSKITGHTLSNMYASEKFMGKKHIVQDGIIRVE